MVVFMLKASAEVSFSTLEKLRLLLGNVSMDCKQSIFGNVLVYLYIEIRIDTRNQFCYSWYRLKRYEDECKYLHMVYIVSGNNLKRVALHPDPGVCPKKTIQLMLIGFECMIRSVSSGPCWASSIN